jgi:PAS domain S-box-containing protein
MATMRQAEPKSPAMPRLAAMCEGPLALFDSLDEVLFWVKDSAGQFLWANTTMALLYGFKSPGDMVGRNDFDLFDPPMAHQYLADDEQVLQGGPITHRVEVIVVNHAARWFRTSKVPLRDSDGRVIGTAGVAIPLADPGLQVPTEFPLGAAMRFMSSHYQQHITNRQLAMLSGQSVAAFCRNFRRTYDCAPHEYLRRLRVKLSCRALVFSDDSLSSIAIAYGFSDQSHFAKEFRRIMGVLPRDYRRRHKR